jgi:hypothetical protein
MRSTPRTGRQRAMSITAAQPDLQIFFAES